MHNLIEKCNMYTSILSVSENFSDRNSVFFSDPYVKVWLMRGDKRLEKHKTPVYKCTLNPVFNEVFTFIVSWEHIRETSLAITVMDWDNVGRNEPIGGIVLSSKSGPAEAKHWGEMLTKPRTPCIQWHKLKPLWEGMIADKIDVYLVKIWCAFLTPSYINIARVIQCNDSPGASWN